MEYLRDINDLWLSDESANFVLFANDTIALNFESSLYDLHHKFDDAHHNISNWFLAKIECEYNQTTITNAYFTVGQHFYGDWVG